MIYIKLNTRKSHFNSHVAVDILFMKLY